MKNDFYEEWKKRPTEAIYIKDFYKELKKISSRKWYGSKTMDSRNF